MLEKTPFYLFDEEKFCHMVKMYQTYGKIYYPVKANDDEMIISIIKDNNCCFEVDSIEHIKLLIDNYKVEPHKLLYSFPIKAQSDIKEALQMGVNLFVVDSMDEYNKIASISNKVRFVFRINVLQILNNNLSPEKDKWGLNLDDAKMLILLSRKGAINVVGISFYIMAEIENKNSFEIVLKKITSEFKDISVEFLNIGGGISLEQLNDINYLIETTKKSLNIEYVAFEPGRHLLNPCIEMVVSVTAIKYIKGNKLVFIDAGIYNGLIDAVVKNKKYCIIDRKQTDYSILSTSYICGSSSDISDTLGAYELREDLSVGDLLFIEECGAYSSVLQTCFYNKQHIDMVPKEKI